MTHTTKLTGMLALAASALFGQFTPVILPAPDGEATEVMRAAVLEARVDRFEVPPPPAIPDEEDLLMMQAPAPAPAPSPLIALGTTRIVSDEERLYRNGKAALEARRWDEAIAVFQRLIEKRGARADASYYWKAYAQNRLNRRAESLATLDELMRAFPSSRWLDDAKALQLEVKQSSGQSLTPEAEADEDLKLLAVNGMLKTDPEHGVPVLEGILRKSSSPRLKDRAIFVLAQSRSARAREVLLSMAKGGTNPDLQHKAVEYLGYQNTPETRQALADIYTSASDVPLKRAALRGMTAARDRERLFAAAKGEQALELRREAVRGLGNLAADAELWQLLRAESAGEVKVEIVRALPSRKENLDKLIEFAKLEKDARVKRELIYQLGNMRLASSSDALLAMYADSGDPILRKTVLEALYNQNNARALVDIARHESDRGLKKTAVEMLSHMKSKEATDFLVEVLNK